MSPRALWIFAVTLVSMVAFSACSYEQVKRMDRCVTMSLEQGPAYILCALAEWTGAQWIGSLAVVLGFVAAVIAWRGRREEAGPTVKDQPETDDRD